MLFAEDWVSFSHIPKNLQAWIYSHCWKSDKMYIQGTQARMQIPASKCARAKQFQRKYCKFLMYFLF